MGSSTPFDPLVSASCKSCLCSLSCEELCVKRENCTFSDIENNLKENSLEELEISSSSEEDNLDTSVLQLGILLSEVLHVGDNLEPLCVTNLISYQDENCILDTSMLDSTSKNSTVLFSSVQPSTLDVLEELPCDAVCNCISIDETPTSAYNSTVLFSSVQPSTLDVLEELPCDAVCNDISIDETPTSAYILPVKQHVSAMKGSREKQGKYPSTKLRVTWAPEVYDPPATSSSHTVKGHRRNHHKTKKDRNLYKNVKGKSPRGSGSEKKHTHHRNSRSTSTNSIDPQTLRLLQLLYVAKDK